MTVPICDNATEGHAFRLHRDNDANSGTNTNDNANYNDNDDANVNAISDVIPFY